MLILIGCKGSGKTTVGKTVAHLKNLPFFDTDELLLNNFQASSIKSLYQTLGPTSFRKEEQKIIASLHLPQNSILATGGGTLFHPEAEKTLRKLGSFIYLKVSFETLESRGILPPEGPLLHHYQKQNALYDTIKAFTIFVDGKTPLTIAKEIGDFCV